MASSAINNKTIATGILPFSAKTALDKRINNSNCGIMIGNPSMAIIAAFCCAFAAIAARNVNTKLRLQPPNKTSPTNAPAFSVGLPRNKLNNARLSKLIKSMSKELKSNLAKTKSLGPATE